MADIEKIEQALLAATKGATRGPFIVVPPTARGEPADIYMSRDENGIYEGWISEMALTADAEHFAACSPDNIRALLDELSRLREGNRKLHRRAQMAEALNQSVEAHLQVWRQVLRNSTGQRHTEYLRFGIALDDIEKTRQKLRVRFDRVLSERKEGQAE